MGRCSRSFHEQPRACFRSALTCHLFLPLSPSLRSVSMSDRAIKVLAEGFLPGEPRLYDAMSKRRNTSLGSGCDRLCQPRRSNTRSTKESYRVISGVILRSLYNISIFQNWTSFGTVLIRRILRLKESARFTEDTLTA